MICVLVNILLVLLSGLTDLDFRTFYTCCLEFSVLEILVLLPYFLRSYSDNIFLWCSSLQHYQILLILHTITSHSLHHNTYHYLTYNIFKFIYMYFYLYPWLICKLRDSKSFLFHFSSTQKHGEKKTILHPNFLSLHN
jgi:hypothetical protein